MQIIPAHPPQAPTHVDALAFEVTAGVIGCIGSSAFGQEVLVQLNRRLPVSWWSVFLLHEEQPPHMPLSGSFRAPDHTRDSWSEYRTHLYRHDQTFAQAREQSSQCEQLLVHWNAREIPAAHRRRIYTRFGLRERLSIVRRECGNALLAINLYRHEELPSFSSAELDLLGGLAGLFTSCVSRHVALAGTDAATPGPFHALTRREHEVCLRMLKGWTFDGIAADLGITPGTVKTYRNRAFERLGIHHRNELYALAQAGAGLQSAMAIKADRA